MNTNEAVEVTRIFPLLDRQVVMVHVAQTDLTGDWLGPVHLRCDEQTIPMVCVGVGETGGEPAVMLRPAEPGSRTIQDVLAAVREQSTCPMYLERVPASSTG
jgi:hypothetical protein